MSQKDLFPGWNKLSPEEKQIIQEWIQSLLRAKAASETLINLFNRNQVDELEQLTEVKGEILFNEKISWMSSQSNKNNIADKKNFSQDEVVDFFANAPDRGEEAKCLITYATCLVKKRLGSSELDCDKEYKNCLNNI